MLMKRLNLSLSDYQQDCVTRVLYSVISAVFGSSRKWSILWLSKCNTCNVGVSAVSVYGMELIRSVSTYLEVRVYNTFEVADRMS
jgi:hypothetical protein